MNSSPFTTTAANSCSTIGCAGRTGRATGLGKPARTASSIPNWASTTALPWSWPKFTADAVLLTGDQRLRRVAEQQGVAVHGILWILDQAYEQERLRLQPFILRCWCWTMIR